MSGGRTPRPRLAELRAARAVLSRQAMPTLEHEAPLVLFRERPELAAELLRDLLGVEVPVFRVARVVEADLTQLVPTELRADLVVELEHDDVVAMGVIVEVQRQVDERKWFRWPLYAAALHARTRCPVALVVIAVEAEVAAWAARPITSVQPGSPFVPLVIGPERIPRIVDADDAARAPELAVLSALTHGSEEVVRAAVRALPTLESERATLYFDLLIGTLGELARVALEKDMRAYKYEYRSDFARKYFGEGRAEGLRIALRATVSGHLGAVPPAIAGAIDEASYEQLLAWVAAMVTARDPDAVAAVFVTP